ncbi:MAG: hypothetical protein R3A47_01775 [Polyangiales bacterium]
MTMYLHVFATQFGNPGNAVQSLLSTHCTHVRVSWFAHGSSRRACAIVAGVAFDAGKGISVADFAIVAIVAGVAFDAGKGISVADFAIVAIVAGVAFDAGKGIKMLQTSPLLQSLLVLHSTQVKESVLQTSPVSQSLSLFAVDASIWLEHNWPVSH